MVKTLAILVVVAIAIYLFLRWNRRPVHWEVNDVEKLLKDVLKDDYDFGTWDYFESCEIQNPALEKIRQECLQIYVQGSPYLDSSKPAEFKLSQRGVQLVSRLKAECAALREAS